jgi:hypothetical protein
MRGEKCHRSLRPLDRGRGPLLPYDPEVVIALRSPVDAAEPELDTELGVGGLRLVDGPV